MSNSVDNLEQPRRIGSFTAYNVTAVRGADAYLFVADDVSFLYDSGFGFCSETLYANIKNVLGDRPLDYILLTHSHYDHAQGSAYLTIAYPDVQVVAFSYAARILEKDSARATMRRLNEQAAALHGVSEFNDYTDHLHADIKVEDNDELMLGSHKVRIISLPGHTKDCVAYYFEDEKIFLSTETLGMYVSDGLVMPSFLVGYKMSLDSIAKAGTFDIDYYLIPHWGFITGGENVKQFLVDSVKGHQFGHDLIVNAHNEGKGHEEIYKLFEDAFYTDKMKVVYPPAAFAENTNIQIPMILREDGLI